MNQLNYKCPKYGNHTYITAQIFATKSTISKIFDVQTKKYTSITYECCTYTKFFKAKTNALGNIFDLFTN